jgi:adenine-specific DNA methylase
VVEVEETICAGIEKDGTRSSFGDSFSGGGVFYKKSTKKSKKVVKKRIE